MATTDKVEVNIFELELAGPTGPSLTEPKASLDTLAQLSSSESLVVAQSRLSLKSLSSKSDTSQSLATQSFTSSQTQDAPQTVKTSDGLSVLRHLFLDKPLSTSAQALISPPLPVFQQNSRAHFTKPIDRFPTANYEMDLPPFKPYEVSKTKVQPFRGNTDNAQLILPSRVWKPNAPGATYSGIKPIPYLPYHSKFEEFAKTSHPTHSKASIMVFTSPSLYNLELDMRPELPALSGSIFHKPYFGSSRLGDGLSPPTIPQQPPPNPFLNFHHTIQESGLDSDVPGSHHSRPSDLRRVSGSCMSRPNGEPSIIAASEHLGQRHSQSEAMMTSIDFPRRSSNQTTMSRIPPSAPPQPYAAMQPPVPAPFIPHPPGGSSYSNSSTSGAMSLSAFPSELSYHQGYGRPDYPASSFPSSIGGPTISAHSQFRQGASPMYPASDIRPSFNPSGSYPATSTAGSGMVPSSAPSSYGMRPLPLGFANASSSTVNSVVSNAASAPDPTMRRNKILERNRQAAVRSRQKKKKELETLVQTLDAMEERYIDLENQLRLARKERDDLRRKLFSHRDCGCDVIGTYEQLQKLQSKNRSYTDSKSGSNSTDDVRNLSAKESTAFSFKGKRTWSSQLKSGSFSSTSSRREGVESNDGDEEEHRMYSDDDDTSSQYDSTDMIDADQSDDNFSERKGFSASRIKNQRLE